MKLSQTIPLKVQRLCPMAFTLPELLIAIAVFGFVIGGVLTANLFGLRIFQITQNKLAASDAARKTLGKISDDIRNCKTAFIANVSSNGMFTALSDGVTQSGAGLILYPTTNTNSYIVYFLNPSDKTFRRTTSATNTTMILAQSITNPIVFRAQDFRGNVLTNSQNNRVIYLELECYQPKRFGVVADYYKLETAVTRRALQ
jgi:prepilin-type N-terminal cleavage/methylation domain-containing protein